MPAPNKGDFSNAKGSKGKEKGIIIIELAPSHLFLFSQMFLERLPNQNVMGKGKLGGLKEAPVSTRPHTASGTKTLTFTTPAALIQDLGLIIHKHPLFRTMVLFNPNATTVLDRSSTIMLNNFNYNIKLA